jgi:nitrogen-specific signal transduction histidine kinase
MKKHYAYLKQVLLNVIANAKDAIEQIKTPIIVKTLLEKHLYGTISCKNHESEFEGVAYKESSFSVTLPKRSN